MAVRIHSTNFADPFATVAPHQLHSVSEDEVGSRAQGTWGSYGWES